jgi:hypothetical protein
MKRGQDNPVDLHKAKAFGRNAKNILAQKKLKIIKS